MADSSTSSATPAAGTGTGTGATTVPTTAAAKLAVKPRAQNPALRMMGLPNLPRKLPSRNWMIFLGITSAITAAVIYDKRGKSRATAKWRRAVAPLATETIASPSQLPRKLTIYLEAPPGDSLRSAQDHFIEYAKPVLAASGLDWEFVQGRQQGDVRAVVAEKIRRKRSVVEEPDKELTGTDEALVQDIRKRSQIPEYQGFGGDIVIGRHTWKEYVRGLHEGWLGPLAPPALPESEVVKTEVSTETPAEAEKKPERPPQPRPHNSTADYATASLPPNFPAEFAPAAIVPFPHRLGFSHTFVRLGWFFNRRTLADNIGREVAAACFAASREWREADGAYEQELVLKHEEQDWPKFVWKTEPDPEEPVHKEKIWASPVVMDPRVAQPMRRFKMLPEDEAKASSIVVPEEDIEGFLKRSVKGIWRWGKESFAPKHKGPNVGNLDDE